ncbi:LacI family transcriptional regulator [Subtercola boreus]|uniref:LacI family transcriptional regulator n=1 Tax=Subtercola boreus TaxID=120213 RepID=A0A3E0VI00_9MICO|nr:LacI family DNA-binding transcriptional regulator [Subtercola boreus]RFA09265.1 LacI family transcriptional regulator [Subtercola boreus]TQL53706.1 LacI family transcriptional regulator [Subtercola boreus]
MTDRPPIVRAEPGSVSIRDVALRAGVSVGTVSNVLNRPGKVSVPVAERVQAAIAELGFVRNDAARRLRLGHSSSFGLIVLDASNPFFTDVARGAEDEAAEHGYSMLLANSSESLEREATYLDLFESQRTRGVLISPVSSDSTRLVALRSRGIPAVIVDRRLEDTRFSSVSVDDVAGGFAAVAHLLALGHRRVAFVGGPLGIGQVSDRLQGARQAVAVHPDARLEVIETPALSVIEGRAAGLAVTARSPREWPEAIFAANDLLAVGVLQAMNMTGESHVPRHVALVGYDDIAFASATVVPLTSVRQPSEAIGRTAVGLLLEETEGAPGFEPRQVVFQPELVVRESSGG